jgi:hypothetical protein
MRAFKAFMSAGKIPFHLQAKVNRYLEFHYKNSRDLQVRQFDLLKRLSPWLRKELQVHLNKKVLTQFSFFHTMPGTVLAEACCLAEAGICAPGDVVIEQGHNTGRMFFLVRGKLHICPESGDIDAGTDSIETQAPRDSDDHPPSLARSGSRKFMEHIRKFEEFAIQSVSAREYESRRPRGSMAMIGHGGDSKGAEEEEEDDADPGFLMLPPAFIGGHNLFSTKANTYTVTSVAHSELLSISRGDVIAMTDEFPLMKQYFEKNERLYLKHPENFQDISAGL